MIFENSEIGQLYAIYKDAIHKGNSRGKSDLKAIQKYLIDSGFNGCEVSHAGLLRKYKAVKAIKGVHYK